MEKSKIITRFSIIGFFLGCGLPVFATMLAMWYEGCQCTLAQIARLHSSNPLLLLIDTAPAITLVIGYFVGRQYLQLRSSLENNEKHVQALEQTNASIKRFVPSEFLRLLNQSSIMELKLGDNVKREMTVLFSDIRGFSSLSEQLTPNENFRFLNSYLQRMEPAIHRHNGFIDKFVGDSIMALFSTPEEAVLAALDMFEELKTYNRHRAKLNYPPIDLGMGLNAGPLMLGTIGGRDRMEGTVIGDNVNIAARIERLTRIYQARLLVSEQVIRSMDERVYEHARLIDQVAIRGRKNTVTVYEIIDAEQPAVKEKKIAICERYNEAVGLYRMRDYSAARAIFQECLVRYPEDLMSAMYLERLVDPAEPEAADHATAGLTVH